MPLGGGAQNSLVTMKSAVGKMDAELASAESAVLSKFLAGGGGPK